MHRIDWFTDNTDPRLVFFEPDTMHTLAGRARFVDPVDGSLFDVNALVRAPGRPAAPDRLAHQGRRPHPAARRRARTRSRRSTSARGFPLNGGVDVVYVGEGSIGKGYPSIDPEVLGFRETFTRFRLTDPGWFHTESDIGPGRRPIPAARCGGPR